MAKLSKKQKELNQKLENACVVGNLDEVKELINQGANLKVEDRFVENPFLYASANGHLDVVKYFIENGVRVNAKSTFGTTAICRAAGGGHYEVVDYLIDNGAKLDLTFAYAAASNRLDMVKHLHQKGADIRKSPTAIVDASREGFIDIVKYLISIGADIQHNENEAITIASRDGFIEVVKCLHQNGADIHFKNDLMLVSASRSGYLEIVKYYVENGADLDEAIENANPKIKEELISYKEKSLFEDDLKDMVFAKKKTDPLRV